MLQHQPAKVAQRQSRIEDVLDQDDVLALNGIIDVLDQLHRARGNACAAIAGDRDEIEGVVHLDRPCKIRQEDRCTLQHADQHNRLIFVVLGDLCADHFDAFGNLFLS